MASVYAGENGAPRKRARSGSSERDEQPGGTEQLPKKASKSELCSDADRVALLDAGAQYGKVIDRRIRELNVECLLLPLDTSVASLKEKGVRAIVLSGGPNGVNDKKLTYDPALFSCGLPVLGICYGFHLINKHFGGTIGRAQVREDGQFSINVSKPVDCFSIGSIECGKSCGLERLDLARERERERVGDHLDVANKLLTDMAGDYGVTLKQTLNNQL